MIFNVQGNRQSAERAEVPLRPLVPLTVQLLKLELCRALLACLLVLLAVGPLAVHAAVLDEAAGRAVLELDGVAPGLAAVGAGFNATAINGHAIHGVLSRLRVSGTDELDHWPTAQRSTSEEEPRKDLRLQLVEAARLAEEDFSLGVGVWTRFIRVSFQTRAGPRAPQQPENSPKTANSRAEVWNFLLHGLSSPSPVSPQSTSPVHAFPSGGDKFSGSSRPRSINQY
ncbi:hypothetical protein THAOC_17900 [Thalassiosira oceanica]|uniref:Uncharacterized protein n=1 Tax=Thalassiosira oceanica TaxID=159749 RepID=K0S8F3_THAOC|nr:hypothetical protein THAOC_17900 [Thalassiosira oceanica]|eukprot:EJK61585.1 hypothetical protein THAOC_17900 [Thalassiosira oceanica]